MGHDTETKETIVRDTLARLRVYISELPAAIDTYASGATAELPKRIRTEIAGAIKAGVIPAGTEVSVRKNHYKSYSVDVVGWVGSPFTDAYVEHLLEANGNPSARWEPSYHEETATLVENYGQYRSRGLKEYTLALNLALVCLEQIANRHNYNRSDISTDYFDVGYYLTVDASTVHANARHGITVESDPTFRALLADAQIAARALGDKCVKSVCGRRGIDACGKSSLEHLLKVAKRANGRPVEYDKRRRGWFPVGTVVAAMPRLKNGTGDS